MSFLSIASIRTRRKMMNDIALVGAETKATTVEALVRCARVCELPHRKTKYENEF